MLSTTPARQRSTVSRSRPPPSARSRATPRAAEVPELPEYQPPEAPLTAESHRQLATLLNSHYSRHLKTHLQHAAEKLTDSAGDVNDKLSDARVRYERAKEKRRGASASEDVDDEEDDENEEYQRLAETERKVDGVTGRMEEKMRVIIDSEARFQGLQDAMTTLDREVGEAQQAAFGTRRTRGQRRQRHGSDDDDGEDGEQDADYEGTPERNARETNAQNPPSHRLGNALEQGSEKWNGQSLTERYDRFSSTCSLQGLTWVMQVRGQQQLHRLLPHRPRLQVSRRRSATPPTRFYMVCTFGRSQCERKHGGQSVDPPHTQPARPLACRLGRHRDSEGAHLIKMSTHSPPIPRPRYEHEMPTQLRARSDSRHDLAQRLPDPTSVWARRPPNPGSQVSRVFHSTDQRRPPIGSGSATQGSARGGIVGAAGGG